MRGVRAAPLPKLHSLLRRRRAAILRAGGPPSRSLHAYHCRCHLPQSPVTCILRSRAANLFIFSLSPGALHLIWDERTRARDTMFPYRRGYVKLNLLFFFPFNVCVKIRRLLALAGFFISSLRGNKGEREKKKQNSSVQPELQKPLIIRVNHRNDPSVRPRI